MQDEFSRKTAQRKKQELHAKEKHQAKQQQKEKPVVQINIAIIRTHGFRRQLNIKEIEGFTTSLYKIDQIIDNKKQTAAEI
jgi:hypothetical protein